MQRPINIGIYGPRSCGKTCLLAAMYGARTSRDRRITLKFSKDDTIDYLKEKWERLSNGDRPAPTAGIPILIEFSMHFDDQTYDMQVHDLAGELVERIRNRDQQTDRDAASIRDWFSRCDALIICVDCAEPKHESVRERMNEVGKLLGLLRQQAADPHVVSRPMALALTKWDLHRTITEDLDTDPAEAVAFVESHEVYDQLREQVKAFVNKTHVFPVSAFGGHRDEGRPPAEGARPFNIHEPWRWAVQSVHEVLVSQAEERVRKCPRELSNNIRELKKLSSDYGLTKGPYGKRVRSLLNGQVWRRRLWRVKAVVIAAVAVAIATAGFLTWRDYKAKSHLLARFTDSASLPATLIGDADHWLNGRPIVAGWLGWTNEVGNRLKDYKTQQVKTAYDRVRRFRKEHAGEKEAANRADQCQIFLRAYPNAPQSAEVRRWEVDDRLAARQAEEHEALVLLDTFRSMHPADADAAQRRDRCRDFLKDFPKSGSTAKVTGWRNKDSAAADRWKDVQAWSAVLTDLTTLEASSAPTKKRLDLEIKRVAQFLKAHPGSMHVKEANDKIAQLKAARDDALWAVVVTYMNTFPKNYPTIIDKIADYLKSPPPIKHRREAKVAEDGTKRRWDRDDYQKLRNAALRIQDANSIDLAAARARDYLKGITPIKSMKGLVQKWLNWYDALATPTGYYITIASAVIPKSSGFYESTDTRTRFRLIVNGKPSTWTRWVKGATPVLTATKGPFPLTWGVRGTVTVQAEEYDYLSPNDTASGSVTDPTFVLLLLNANVTLTDSDSGTFTVRLTTCPAAIPPALPAYP